MYLDLDGNYSTKLTVCLYSCDFGLVALVNAFLYSLVGVLWLLSGIFISAHRFAIHTKNCWTIEINFALATYEEASSVK